jgi:RNA polymerase sigma-70 factor, ECF subfamily
MAVEAATRPEPWLGDADRRSARVGTERRRSAVASVDRVPSVPRAAEDRATAPLDDESRQWIADLRGDGPEHGEAVARLHALLLRAARFEVARRRPALPHLRGDDLDDVALQAADDALMSVLARLDAFRGLSRFSTWAYKFALLEAAVKLRKRAWQGRELPLEPESWSLFASSGLQPDAEVEQGELLATLQTAIDEVLTPHQRRVLVALAVNGIPIDVLAERLNTTRGALYKTLHDARGKLRNHLEECGLSLDVLEATN